MQVFVVRVTIPDSVAAFQDDVETGRGLSPAFDEFVPMSTIGMLSVGSILDWSLPRHVLVGDVVLFQVSLSARRAAKKVRKGLECDHEYYGEIGEALDLVEKHAGSIMAVARVTDGAHRSEDGGWWGSRYYAPITDIYYVDYPVAVNSPSRFSEWPEFASRGPVQYRQFSSDERYRELIDTLIEEGNDDIPDWATERPVTSLGGVEGVNAENWIEVARSVEIGFPTEASLHLVYSDWLLRELSDGRVLYSEVDARLNGRSVGRIDNVIIVGGVPVPVEIKINAATEKDILGQLDRYRTADTLIAAGRQLPGRSHDVVLLVDQKGLYVTTSETSVVPEPSLTRGAMTPDALAALRAAIERAVDSSRVSHETAPSHRRGRGSVPVLHR